MTGSVDHERAPPPLLLVAVPLSILLGVFAVVGWLLRGGILEDKGFGEISVESAVPALYAGLAVIMQFAAALSAVAARWARGFELTGSEQWARGVVGAAGLWNAYSLHNAFEMAMPDDAGFFTQAIAWAVSAAVAFVEIAIYWIDETLKSEVRRRRSADEAATLASARGMNLTEFEERHLTDAAIAAGIKAATGYKRRLEVERNRREKRNISTNS